MPAKTSIPDETGLVPLEAARLFVAKLRKPAHILVAISGGSDSTGLLLALHEASIGSGDQVRLSAVTVDHALRPESADEAKKSPRYAPGLASFMPCAVGKTKNPPPVWPRPRAWRVTI